MSTPSVPYRGPSGKGSQAEGWRLVVQAESEDREPPVWQIVAPDGNELITWSDPNGLIGALMEFIGAQRIELVATDVLGDEWGPVVLVPRCCVEEILAQRITLLNHGDVTLNAVRGLALALEDAGSRP